MGDEEMKRPAIIVIKGRPSSAKNKLALSVAENLRCPFLDHDFSDYLCYKAIMRMAQAQLRLKLSVIVSSQLSQKIDFDQLVQLAASNDTTFRFIDCISQDEPLPDYYDVGNVTKLVLNLKTTHIDEEAEEDLGTVMQFITFGLTKQDSDSGKEEEEIDEEEDDEKMLKDFAHPDHTLVFCNDHHDDKSNDEKNNIYCRACLEPIYSPMYSCVECKFFLHKSCAELPRKIQSPIYGMSSSLYLNVGDECKMNAQTCCWACGDKLVNWVYTPKEKTYGLDPKCAKLPSTLEGQFHHRYPLLYLTLLSYPILNKCYSCDNECVLPIRYSCSECNFKLHVRCVLLPIVIEDKCHCDPLTLTKYSPLDLSYEYCCDVCETDRNPFLWFYYCSECDYAAHLSCVFSDIYPVPFQTRGGRGIKDWIRRREIAGVKFK